MADMVYSPILQATLKCLTEAEIYNKIEKHRLYFNGNILGELADFSRCSLPDGFSFYGTNLRGALFIRTEGRNIDFSKANLSGCDFSNARFPGANFKGSDLSDCRFVNASISDSNYEDAFVSDATNFHCCNRRKSGEHPKYRLTHVLNGNRLVFKGDRLKDLLKFLYKKDLVGEHQYYCLRKELVLRKNHGSYYDFVKDNKRFSNWLCSNFINKGEDLTLKEELRLIWDLIRYTGNFVELAEWKDNEGRYLPMEF